MVTMQYSCGKININIPDGYGDIKDIVFWLIL